MTKDESQERATFENWFRESQGWPPNHRLPSRVALEQRYELGYMEYMWKGWRARGATAEPSAHREIWCGVCTTKMIEVAPGKWQHDDVGCLAQAPRFHCNICGGEVDLSAATAPSVSTGPGGRSRSTNDREL